MTMNLKKLNMLFLFIFCICLFLPIVVSAGEPPGQTQTFPNYNQGGGTSGFGGDGDVFAPVIEKAIEIFEMLRPLIYVLGGFGLMGFAFGAIFGRIQWKWFATLSCGLFIISTAEQIVSFVTDGGVPSGPQVGSDVGSSLDSNALTNLQSMLDDSW